MRKHKTLHAVVKYFYPVAAGIETNMLETYAVMASKGWDITIHTTKDTLTEQNVLPDEEQIKGLTVKRYPWPVFRWFTSIPFDQVDVVALHNFNVYPHVFVLLLIRLRKLLGKKTPVLILTPHGGYTPDWEIFHPLVGLLKRVYHHTIGAFLIRQAVDGIRAVSNWEQEEIAKHSISKRSIQVISNGMEDEAYHINESVVDKHLKKQIKSWDPYIVQIGRIYSIKNYETALKALSLGPKHVHFVIAGPIGDTVYYQSLLTLIQTYGLSKRVHFLGVIRGHDKYYVIRHAAMMVHMARWESFCNVVHEAMSQGKVVIAANNTALKYLIKDRENGYLVDTFDHKTLAKKIAFVLDPANYHFVERISKTNKTVTEDSTWESVATKIHAWVSELISKRHSLPMRGRPVVHIRI